MIEKVLTTRRLTKSSNRGRLFAGTTARWASVCERGTRRREGAFARRDSSWERKQWPRLLTARKLEEGGNCLCFHCVRSDGGGGVHAMIYAVICMIPGAALRS